MRRSKNTQSHVIINDDDSAGSSDEKHIEILEQNELLKKELDFVKTELKHVTASSTKSGKSLNAQIKAAQDEKNEISRKFFNLTEDHKELQQELTIARKERDEERKKQNLFIQKIQHIKKSADQKETILTLELNDLKKSHNELIQEYEQKEKEYRAEFIERIGGMEEALEDARSEIEAMQQKKEILMTQMNSKYGEVEQEKNILVVKYKNIEKEIEEFRKDANTLREEYSEQKKTISRLENELLSAESRISEDKLKFGKISDEMEAQTRLYTANSKQKESTIVTLKTSKKQLTDCIAHLEKKIVNLITTISDKDLAMQRQTQTSKNDNERYESLCNDLQTEIKNRQDVIDGLQQKLQHTSEQNKTLEHHAYVEKENHQKNIASWQNEKLKLQTLIQNHIERNSVLEQDKLDLEAEAMQLGNKIQLLKVDKDNKIKIVNNQIREIKADYEKQLQNVHEQKDQLTKQLRDISQKHQTDQKSLKIQKKTLIEEGEKLKIALHNAKCNYEVHTQEFTKRNEILKKSIANLTDENEKLQIKVHEQTILLQKGMKTNENINLLLNEREKAMEEKVKDATRANQKLENLKSVLKSLKSEYELVQKKFSICNDKTNKLKASVQVYEKKIKELEDIIKQEKKEMSLLKQKLHEANDSFHLLSVDHKRLAQNMKLCSNQYADKINELKDIIKCQADKFEVLLSQTKAERIEQNVVKISLKATINDLSSEINVASEKLITEREKHAKESEVARLKIADFEKTFESSNEKYLIEIKSHKEESGKLIKKIDKLERNVNNLRIKLDEANIQIEQKSKQLQIYRAENLKINCANNTSSKGLPSDEYDHSDITLDMKSLNLRVQKVLNESSFPKIQSDSLSCDFDDEFANGKKRDMTSTSKSFYHQEKSKNDLKEKVVDDVTKVDLLGQKKRSVTQNADEMMNKAEKYLSKKKGIIDTSTKLLLSSKKNNDLVTTKLDNIHQNEDNHSNLVAENKIFRDKAKKSRIQGENAHFPSLHNKKMEKEA